GMLHQEAGLADELTRALGLDAAGAVGALLGLGLLVLLVVVLLLGGRDPALQDGVEVGFDVVGIRLLVVLVVLALVVALGLDRRDVVLLLVLFVVTDDRIVVIVEQRLVVEVLVQVLLEVFRLVGLDLVVELF